MKFPQIFKKVLAHKLRKTADKLDQAPPRRIESRLEKMKVLANAKPFDEAEAVQIISAIVNKTPKIMVIFYNHFWVKQVDSAIRMRIGITSNNWKRKENES